MKCPRCGSTNGKTNKFCRGCGFRLENLAEREISQAELTPVTQDDMALGEDLFKIWQQFEAGELGAALAGVEKLTQSHPGSASCHSLLALIYERKAQTELETGGEEAGRDFLKLALAQYEKIIDLNPDSAADREKIVALRKKIAGRVEAQAAASPAKPVATLGVYRQALKAIPTPYLAAAGVFFVVLTLAIVLWPGADGGSDRPVRSRRDAASSKLSFPSSSGPAQDKPSSPSLSVYSFPAQPAGSKRPAPNPPPAASAPASPRPERAGVEPVKLPPGPGTELVVTPEPVKKPDIGKAASKAGVTVTPGESRPAQNPPLADGATTLARAIQLRNEGKTDDAVTAAQQAIALFQADVLLAKNVDSAKRGAENAKRLITVWRQSSQ